MRRMRAQRAWTVEGLESRTVLSGGVPGLLSVQSVYGAVTVSGTNEGVGDVPIQLVNLSGRVIRQTVTDGLGRFDIAGLPSDAYVVREAGERGLPSSTTFLNGLAVNTGLTDVSTGGPFPAQSLYYLKNRTVLTAIGTAPSNGLPPLTSQAPEQSPAISIFRLVRSTDRQVASFERFNNASQLSDGISRGSLAGGALLLLALHG